VIPPAIPKENGRGEEQVAAALIRRQASAATAIIASDGNVPLLGFVGMCGVCDSLHLTITSTTTSAVVVLAVPVLPVSNSEKKEEVAEY